MSKEQFLSICLVTDDGGEIQIQYPENILDEFMEDFVTAQSCGEWWNVGNWYAVALYKGHRLETINLNRVIGWR